MPVISKFGILKLGRNSFKKSAEGDQKETNSPKFRHVINQGIRLLRKKFLVVLFLVFQSLVLLVRYGYIIVLLRFVLSCQISTYWTYVYMHGTFFGLKKTVFTVSAAFNIVKVILIHFE